MVGGVTSHPKLGRRQRCTLVLSWLSLFYTVQDPHSGMVPPTVDMGLPGSIHLLKDNPSQPSPEASLNLDNPSQPSSEASLTLDNPS